MTEDVGALRARIAELESRDAERDQAERVQDALLRIADAASSAKDLPSFYATVHGIVGRLMDAENFYIALYDAEREAINFPYYVDTVDTDLPDPAAWDPIGVGEAAGTTGYLLRTGRPLLLDTAGHADLVARGEIQAVGVTPVGGDWVGAPLIAEGETLGAIVVQSYDGERLHTEADRDLLAFVGQHIGSALSRVRAIEETRQRNAELALVNEIGLALGSQMEFEAIIDLVGERLRTLFDAQSMFIAIYDDTTELITFPYEIDEGERLQTESFQLGPGLTSIVIRTRQPLRVALAADADALGAITSGTESNSWLGVPILSGERVIGVICLEDVEANAYDESDERLLSTLASSMAVALESARLFDETKRLLTETDQRNAELAIINSVQEGLAAELDMQAMYDLVGDKIHSIFDTQVVDIGVYDAESGLVHFPYTIERGVRFPDEPMELIGFRKEVLRTSRSLMVNDDLAAKAAVLGQTSAIQGEAARSAIYAPLLRGGRANGVVSLQNLDREHAFTQSDMDLLTTLAASLSVALDNARLIDETRQRAAELAIVNSVGRALAGQLDLDALIEHLGDQMRDTFDADLVYVALHDPERDMIDFVYYSEGGQRGENPAIRYGEGLTSQVLEAREPLLLNKQAEFAGRSMLGTPASSYLGVPILTGDAAIGVISVQDTAQSGRFGEADARLLTTLAANVGVAIQNARLYRDAQRQAAEMTALADVAAEISAMLDLGPVLERITDRAMALLAGDTSAVFLAEEDGQLFRPIVALGSFADAVLGDTIRLGEGIIGDLADATRRRPSTTSRTIHGRSRSPGPRRTTSSTD